MGLNAGARLVRLQPTVNQTISVIVPRFTSGSNRVFVPSYSKQHSSSQRRQASTFTASQSSPTEKPTPSTVQKPPSQEPPSRDTLNPPASTRPPQLNLPVRDGSTNFITHLFKLGKAYTVFYKTGLIAVFTNRRLLRDQPAASSLTRSTLHLRARVRHDILRLPLFGLMALICGELTPLIVLIFPRLTPYTCRIPSQTAVIRRAAEARRRASFRALSHQADKAPAANGHICRSLGLGGSIWDKAGFDVPFARTRADEAVRYIVRDDSLIRSGGGVSLLVDDEVVIACEERGIDTLGKTVPALRVLLKNWLVQTRPAQMKDAETAEKDAVEKTRALLLVAPDA